MTADEQKEKDEAEKREKLENDYNALLKKVTVSDNTAKLLGLGYDEALAGRDRRSYGKRRTRQGFCKSEEAP